MSASTTLQKRKRLPDGEDGGRRSAAPPEPRGEASADIHDRGDGVEPQPAGLEADCDAISTGIPSGSQHSESAWPGLQFATESWTGLKPTNEDRSVNSVEGLPLGPAFAVYDGHGGTFTVDLITRSLLKAMGASVRQLVGDKQQLQLTELVAQSHAENKRRREISEQITIVKKQLEQVAEILVSNGDSSGDKTNGALNDNEEAGGLREQLDTMLQDMESEVARIEKDEVQRQEQRRRWYESQDSAIRRAITEAFHHIDEQVLRKNSSRDGSTALIVWLFGGGSGGCKDAGLYAVNLGDCRAVLCRSGTSIRLTNDHKPDRPDEKRRIEAAGGFVGTFTGVPRVFSAAGAGLTVQGELSTFLAVSRAFGDRPLKLPSMLVSNVPEITRFELVEGDSFIVVACDGIWDVLTDQEAVDIALQHLNDPKAAADAIVRNAYMKGSADNLTATVVRFGWRDGHIHQLFSTASAREASLADDESTAAANDQVTELQSGRVKDTSEEVTAGNGCEDEEVDMFNL